jgi:hypothetical protein
LCSEGLQDWSVYEESFFCNVINAVNKAVEFITASNAFTAAEGAFRWLHKGMYTQNPDIPGDHGGPQYGELCVLKDFKTGSVYEESFFCNVINAVNETVEFITAFNAFNAVSNYC